MKLDHNLGFTHQAIYSKNYEQFEGHRVKFKASYYATRICQYSGVSHCCFIAALIYLERYLKLEEPRSLLLTSKTLQRLFLVAVMTAAKFLEDECLLNSSW
jgi:hypothetical protein